MKNMKNTLKDNHWKISTHTHTHTHIYIYTHTYIYVYICYVYIVGISGTEKRENDWEIIFEISQVKGF